MGLGTVILQVLCIHNMLLGWDTATGRSSRGIAGHKKPETAKDCSGWGWVDLASEAGQCGRVAVDGLRNRSKRLDPTA